MKLSPRKNRIRLLRRACGLAQPELACLIGSIGKRHVSRLENGAHEPNLEQALTLELVLGARLRRIFPELRRKAREAVIRRLRAMEMRLLTRAEHKKRASKLVARLARIRAAIESRSDDHEDDDMTW